VNDNIAMNAAIGMITLLWKSHAPTVQIEVCVIWSGRRCTGFHLHEAWSCFL